MLQLATKGNYSATIDPLVIFSILDHYARRDVDQTMVLGVVLGIRQEDTMQVQVRNSFPIQFEDTGDQITIDSDYLNQMYQLYSAVNDREKIVGWYATGDKITSATCEIHDFFANEASIQQPVHVMVDSLLSGGNMDIRAYTGSQICAAGWVFNEMDCKWKLFDAERVGLRVISQARSSSEAPSEIISDLENLEKSMKKVQDMLYIVKSYVDQVVDGSAKPDNALGRVISDTVSSIPRIDPTVFETMFSNHLKDIMMIVYLSNLTASQLEIAEKLTSLSLK